MRSYKSTCIQFNLNKVGVHCPHIKSKRTKKSHDSAAKVGIALLVVNDLKYSIVHLKVNKVLCILFVYSRVHAINGPFKYATNPGPDPDTLKRRVASRGASEKDVVLVYMFLPFLSISRMKMTNFPIKRDANPCTAPLDPPMESIIFG